MLGAQPAQQVQLGLEIDVVRQLQVLHEAGGLDIVGVGQHEFLVLGRRRDRLAQLPRPQRAVDQRHGHRLALGLAEDEAVAAGEVRRRGRRAGELVDHLAFGERDLADLDREAQLLRHDLDRDLADADLAGEGVVAAIAALGRIAEGQQEALVAARQVLQAQVAVGREIERLAGEVAGRGARRGGGGSISPRGPGCRRRGVPHRSARPVRHPVAAAAYRRPARSRAGGGCSRRSGPAPGRPARP